MLEKRGDIRKGLLVNFLMPLNYFSGVDHMTTIYMSWTHLLENVYGSMTVVAAFLEPLLLMRSPAYLFFAANSPLCSSLFLHIT